ncbi:MAG: tRNA (adenosine(37)-N6)-threonylcarbamoyltransferase complex transferase subunit TsaD [Saprospiraceae bacterium]|nr:tRNA (adenosine(37)-N6)-threonylcarbamoyltransferase complex transferase subunit TsaD [Saprospiraceae bacterium]
MGDVLLAIESSCDDTGAAVFVDGELRSNVVQSQMVHQKYGGVVPEVASREHLKAIVPVVTEALSKAELRAQDVNAVACTRGPGLLGALMVGYSFAKSFAASQGIPLINVDHMRAHILAHLIEEPKPNFPFLCLTVSGGHTQLVIVRDAFTFECIGQTLDDAAGEAFDKTGKMLGLPYPAGPAIDRLAKDGRPVFNFAKAKVDAFDFSFSGFKTSVLYFLRDKRSADPDFIQTHLSDLCASIQTNIVSVLMERLKEAAQHHGITEIAVAGGVSANSELRNQLSVLASQNGWNSYVPKIAFCTDNAAMIGITGYIDWKEGHQSTFDMAPDPRLTYATH